MAFLLALVDLLTSQRLVIATILVTMSMILLLIRKTRNDLAGGRRAVPEAEGGWPLLGHVHLLAVKVPTYRVLGAMADKYGPIFSIRLGRKRILIVSSWEIAKECFGTHDKVFLNRPYLAGASLVYGGAMFNLGRYGQYWRNMRRISTERLLSNTRLELLKDVRSSEIKACVKHLFSRCSSGPAKVDMSEWSSVVVLNVLTQMIAGKRCNLDKDDVESRRFLRAMEDLLKLLGTFTISDVVPITEWMDLQGHFKAIKKTAKICDDFLSNWLEEHVEKRKENKEQHNPYDFIDVMLSELEKDPSLGCQHSVEVTIKSILLSLIIGGTETMAIGMTWVLSMLANHPEAMKRARDEINAKVGKERWVEEADMKELKYNVAVLKESMRLYVPQNVPRESIEDCTIAGYHIPKGTSLIVNMWKVHHDARVWENPNEFRPERFLSEAHSHVDVRGQNFEYIPFSAGRRSCPGITSAMQILTLAFTRVLQGFDLATPDGQKVDLTEGLGLLNPKATPLELILTPRLPRELY